MPRSPPPTETVAARFRREIEQAESNGAARAAMTLKLTFYDHSRLLRDPSLAVADISFAKGVMSYLGVAVTLGGVTESALDCRDP